MKRRGTSLGTALLVAALLLTLGLTAGSISTSNLSLSRRAVNSQTARNIAEATVSLAISRLKRDPAYGTTATTREVEVKFDSGAEGRLTFDPASDGPFSSNNLNRDSSSPGWNNAVVPAQSVHLIGTGTCNGATSRIEAVIFISRFPYAVASSGPIYSQGGLEVSSIDEVPDEQNGPTQKHPASMASNSRDNSRAIHLLGPGIDVRGDVQASGAIKLGPEVAVGGAIRPNEDPIGLPQIDFAEYDTLGKPGVANLPQSDYGELKIEGYARLNRALQVRNGLKLHNGVLFVDGDLDVRGGISGTGAVIVKGNTQVTGSSDDWDSKARAALLSKGDVRLQGSPSQFQAFQGLVYTEGNFSSKFVDLAGVFVANRADGSEVQMDNTRLVQLPMPSVKFAVVPPQAGPGPTVTPPSTGTGTGMRPLSQGIVCKNPYGSAMANLWLDLSKVPVDPATGKYSATFDPTAAMVFRIEDGMTVRAEFPATDTQKLSTWASTGGYTLLMNQGRQVALNIISNEPPVQITPTPSVSGSPTASPTPGPGPTTSGEEWSLDLSRFIQIKDRMRVLLWREL